MAKGTEAAGAKFAHHVQRSERLERLPSNLIHDQRVASIVEGIMEVRLESYKDHSPIATNPHSGLAP